MKKLFVSISIVVAIVMMCGCTSEKNSSNSPGEESTSILTEENSEVTGITEETTVPVEFQKSDAAETTKVTSYVWSLDNVSFETSIFDTGWMTMEEAISSGLFDPSTKTISEDGLTERYTNAAGDIYQNQTGLPTEVSKDLRKKIHSLPEINMSILTKSDLTPEELAGRIIKEYNIVGDYKVNILPSTETEIAWEDTKVLDEPAMVIVTIGYNGTTISICRK